MYIVSLSNMCGRDEKTPPPPQLPVWVPFSQDLKRSIYRQPYLYRYLCLLVEMRKGQQNYKTESSTIINTVSKVDVLELSHENSFLLNKNAMVQSQSVTLFSIIIPNEMRGCYFKHTQ